MDNETVYNFTAENMDEQPGFSPALLTFAAVLTFIIMIVGIFGNFLTVVALLKCPKVRNVAAAFIISLCMADLIFCALVLPFSALRFIEGTWTHGDVLCKLIPFIQYGNIGVSLLCIGMITINRYVMIAHHSSYAKIYKKQWIAAMIAFCWLFSYGMQLPTLLGAWGVFDYDPRLGTCSIMTDAHGRSSKTTLFIIAFVIPCLIIIACYAKIFWVVHESEARLKKHANKQNSIPNNQRQIASAHVTSDQQTRGSTNVGSESSFSTDFKQECVQKQTRIKDQRDLRAKRNEWRITKMVLAIFLSFVVCYLPITLAKVVDKNVEHPTLHILGYIMLYLSACINPIIYVIMNKQYRKAYQTVILCEPARLLPFGKHAGGGGGGSSAAEMERYRVEQQPQPHHGVADVGGGAAKYQLQPLPAGPQCPGDDRKVGSGCGKFFGALQLKEAGKGEFLAIDGRYHLRDPSAERKHSQPTGISGPNAADPARPRANSVSRGRHNPRRGGGRLQDGGAEACLRHSERLDRDKPERDWQPEENPILWSKHQRHSR